MNSSTYPPNDEQNYDATEYPQDTGYYSYSNAQPSYTYQPPVSYDYNTLSTYTSASMESQYAFTQSTLQGTYNGPVYSQYDDSSTTYVPQYSSYPPVSSSSDIISQPYDQIPPVSSGSSGPIENWESFPTITEEEASYTTSQYRGSDEHSSGKTVPKTKHSKTGNMRTPRKPLGPPPEFTSVFVVNPESRHRKSRKTFTDEEKKKVEAVRSIGACGPCRQNKRTCGTERPCKTCVDRAGANLEKARAHCTPGRPRRSSHSDT